MNDTIKNIIKGFLSINTFSNASFYSKLGNSNRIQLESLLSDLSTQDYLSDITVLKEFQRKVKEEQEVFSTFDVNWSNTHIYGIWQGIFGAESVGRALYLPAVEHGLIFHDDVFTDIRTTARQTIATFSDFRKSIIQKKIHRPVFCVGPYTHYCKGFYSEDRLAEEKIKLGKIPEKKAFLSGFQLVHGEYFYDHKAMSMTISKGLLSFNLNCIRQLQGVKYVELLFNPVDRCMAIRPTDESNPNAIAWCDLKDGKYISRTRSCKGFCQALFSIMGWDSEQRYTFTGRYREFQGEQILIFELADTISYEDVESEGKEKKVAHYTDEDDEEFGGDSVDEEADCLVPEMYTAEWGVLRPARTYKGCYGLSEKKSEELLREAQKIIERIKSQNGGVTESGDNSLGSEGDGARE